MHTQVTLTLPDTLYKNAKRLARSLNRNVSDVLVEAIQLDSVVAGVQEDPVVEQEREGFLKLHPMLWKQYPGEYVALQGGKLIDHDHNRSALFSRINQKYPDQFVLMRRVTAQPEGVYKFRLVAITRKKTGRFRNPTHFSAVQSPHFNFHNLTFPSK